MPKEIELNIEKYYIIKKVFYLSSIEEIEGDYLEFGVYTGSSFCHSMRCCKNYINLNSKINKTIFYGFDSFEGFGEVAIDDKHSFYTDANFATNYSKVYNRVKKVADGLKFKLIQGYFNETLREGPESLGITKSRIIFIDSDTYSSAKDALHFCNNLIQEAYDFVRLMPGPIDRALGILNLIYRNV